MTTGRINQVARDARTKHDERACAETAHTHARRKTPTRPAFDTRPRMCRGVAGTTQKHTRGRAKLAGGAVKAGTRVKRDPTERLTPGVCAPRPAANSWTHRIKRTLTVHPRGKPTRSGKGQERRRIKQPLEREITNARRRKRIAATHTRTNEWQDAEAPPNDRQCDRRIDAAVRH